MRILSFLRIVAVLAGFTVLAVALSLTAGGALVLGAFAALLATYLPRR